MLANSASSTLSYLRQKRVDVKSGLIFSAAGIPGALLGAYADQHVPHHIFTMLFGVSARRQSRCARSSRAMRRKRRPTPTRCTVERRRIRAILSTPSVCAINTGSTFGAASRSRRSPVFSQACSGSAAASCRCPAMVYLFGFPTHIAVATSQLVIAVDRRLRHRRSRVLRRHLASCPRSSWRLAPSAALSSARTSRRACSRGPLMRWFSLAIAAAALYLIFRG